MLVGSGKFPSYFTHVSENDPPKAFKNVTKMCRILFISSCKRYTSSVLANNSHTKGNRLDLTFWCPLATVFVTPKLRSFMGDLPFEANLGGLNTIATRRAPICPIPLLGVFLKSQVPKWDTEPGPESLQEICLESPSDSSKMGQ